MASYGKHNCSCCYKQPLPPARQVLARIHSGKKYKNRTFQKTGLPDKKLECRSPVLKSGRKPSLNSTGQCFLYKFAVRLHFRKKPEARHFLSEKYFHPKTSFNVQISKMQFLKDWTTWKNRIPGVRSLIFLEIF